MNLFEMAFDLWRMFDHNEYTSDAQMLRLMHEALGEAYAAGFEDGLDEASAADGRLTDAVDRVQHGYDPMEYVPVYETDEVSTWYRGIDGTWTEYTPQPAPDMGPRLG